MVAFRESHCLSQYFSEKMFRLDQKCPFSVACKEVLRLRFLREIDGQKSRNVVLNKNINMQYDYIRHITRSTNISFESYRVNQLTKLSQATEVELKIFRKFQNYARITH